MNFFKFGFLGLEITAANENMNYFVPSVWRRGGRDAVIVSVEAKQTHLLYLRW
jgi:hypothetical protein